MLRQERPLSPDETGRFAVRTLTSSLTAGRLSSCRVLPANGTIVDDFYRSLASDVAWVHDLALAEGREATRTRGCADGRKTAMVVDGAGRDDAAVGGGGMENG